MELEKRIEKALELTDNPQRKEEIKELVRLKDVCLLEDRENQKAWFTIDSDGKIQFRGFGI